MKSGNDWRRDLATALVLVALLHLCVLVWMTVQVHRGIPGLQPRSASQPDLPLEAVVLGVVDLEGQPGWGGLGQGQALAMIPLLGSLRGWLHGDRSDESRLEAIPTWLTDSQRRSPAEAWCGPRRAPVDPEELFQRFSAIVRRRARTNMRDLPG